MWSGRDLHRRSAYRHGVDVLLDRTRKRTVDTYLGGLADCQWQTNE